MTEAEEQRHIVAWFRSRWPQYAMSVRLSQTAGAHGGKKTAARRWANMKSQGGVKGEADLAILLPRSGFGCLLIEHKAHGSKHKTTDEQKDYIEYHNTVGNCACVTRGIDAAKAAILTYMAGVADER